MVDYVNTSAPEPTTPVVTDVPATPLVITPETTSVNTEALGVIIPSAAGRKLAYAIYAGASLIVTNVAVGFSAIGANNPAWLTIALAVVGNLASAFGALAIANASNKK
ncbi:hypothetical protein UFOVP111_95 [uncultured Caudovirales phage]|uniref:Holin n=1 Tax=uncultured Caudovirales phage TaxID=2100421 RepID=A0A6J5L3E5_9CAUD|nr:hypothetical protein UFOVP111_95 [uncultured Caudovirales phage]